MGMEWRDVTKKWKLGRKGGPKGHPQPCAISYNRECVTSLVVFVFIIVAFQDRDIHNPLPSLLEHPSRPGSNAFPDCVEEGDDTDGYGDPTKTLQPVSPGSADSGTAAMDVDACSAHIEPV